MKKSREHLKWLIENFNYLDSVTMIDSTGKIIVKKRYSPRFSDEENEMDNEWCIDKNLLEAFPSLNHNTSTLLVALNTGDVIYSEGQSVISHSGKKSVTNNLTFPIINKGKIVGAVELSRDVTNIEKTMKPRIVKGKGKASGSGNYAKWNLDDIVTQNGKMLELKKTIEQIADSKSSVLVVGETGTGKELVVSAIHNASYRKDKPFIAINCAALPESILEGLLFGSQKGAFTGAENKKGILEEANGGTVYLDEINSMPVMLQAKLLRVLQEKAVRPLGASEPVEIDVRIISSVNKPINAVISSGEMREDILYRLNTLSIEIPPLRERLDDVKLLCDYFIEKHNEEMGKRIKGISKGAVDFLVNNEWKGNVRELENVIESAINMVENDKTIELDNLPAYLMEQEESHEELEHKYDMLNASLNESLEAYEKKLILDALKSSNWKIVDAAKKLKIPRTSLQYKMDKYGIKRR